MWKRRKQIQDLKLEIERITHMHDRALDDIDDQVEAKFYKWKAEFLAICHDSQQNDFIAILRELKREKD